jgi:hypothetical protein
MIIRRFFNVSCLAIGIVCISLNFSFAMECSVSFSEKDQQQYQSFLNKFGTYIYQSSGLKLGDQQSKDIANALLNDPHVSKFWKPATNYSMSEMLSLVSAMNRKRSQFIGESPGTEAFVKAVEKALFKVDTMYTNGLLNESLRPYQKEKEHITPELIGKNMANYRANHGLSGHAGSSSQKQNSTVASNSSSNNTAKPVVNTLAKNYVFKSPLSTNLGVAELYFYDTYFKRFDPTGAAKTKKEFEMDIKQDFIPVKKIENLIDVMIFYISAFGNTKISKKDIDDFSLELTKRLFKNVRAIGNRTDVQIDIAQMLTTMNEQALGNLPRHNGKKFEGSMDFYDFEMVWANAPHFIQYRIDPNTQAINTGMLYIP